MHCASTNVFPTGFTCGKTEEPGNSNLWFPGSRAIARQQVAVGPADPRHMVYPLMPDVLMPSTRLFWKSTNRIMIGTSDSTDMASMGP